MPIDPAEPRAAAGGADGANNVGSGGGSGQRLWVQKLRDGVPFKIVWHGTLNTARWAILCGLLVFLLSAILALHEALNFQDRVVELAGNDKDRARRVFSVLHDTIENPKGYVEDRSIPFASIAVKLDRLSRAQELLHQFELEDDASATTGVGEPQGMSVNGKQPRAQTVGGKVVDAVKNGAIHPPAVDGQPKADEPVTAFKSALNRLKISVADLDGTMLSSDPDRRLVDALNEAKHDLDALKVFEGGPKIADDATTSSTGSALADDDATEQGTKIQFELQQAVDELEDDLLEVEQQAKTQPGARLLVLQLDALHRSVAGLDAYLNAALTMSEQPAQPEPVQQPIEKTLEVIDRDIEDLRKTLSEADQGFVAASKLATLINGARDFSNRLTNINAEGVKFRDPQSGEIDSGTKAAAMFDSVRGEMSETILAIEEQLGTRTRVIAVAEQLDLEPVEGTDGRKSRAAAILRDFDAVGRFETVLMPFSSLADTKSFGWTSSIGLDPQTISTLHRETLALLFVFVVGAIGSVIYITKYSIQLVLEGNWLTDRPKRSLAWYLFRPFFGVIVALAAFLLFKAGQLALGNGGVLDGSGDFNLPILSVIALFAGLLSWQALEAIETRGATWLRSQKRQYLWATGLDNGLREERHSRQELASSVGRSVDQVFRWLVYRDRVSPEMQDRIADWLDVPPNQLFRNEEPQRKTLWLKVATADRDGIGRKEFEDKLASEHFDPDKLGEWLSQSGPVPRMAHDRIILAMDQHMSEIFTDQPPNGRTTTSVDDPRPPRDGDDA